MTKQEAESFLAYYRAHGCRDYSDASKLGQAMATLMTDEQKEEARKIIQKNLCLAQAPVRVL